LKVGLWAAKKAGDLVALLVHHWVATWAAHSAEKKAHWTADESELPTVGRRAVLRVVSLAGTTVVDSAEPTAGY